MEADVDKKDGLSEARGQDKEADSIRWKSPDKVEGQKYHQGKLEIADAPNLCTALEEEA